MRRAVLAPAALLPAGLIAAAALIQLLTAWQAPLQYDRTAVASGQLWRLLTCHLVHCGWAHLIADLVGFATLWWLACRRPRPVPWLVLISALAIGTALCLLASLIVLPAFMALIKRRKSTRS